MFFAPRPGIVRVFGLAALTLILAAAPVHAQRTCMRQQSAQSSLRSQSFNTLTSPYALQQSALQQYALQQYALQAQLNGLTQNVFWAQVNGAQLNGGQVNGLPTVEVLQARLDALQDYISDQQENGRLTSSQLKALRQQEKTLTRQLRAAEKRAARSSQKQSQSATRASTDN
jgi:hypothetical protein